MVGRSAPVRLVLSVLLVGGPIFFASVCFALRFQVRPAADIAFGWNLLGAVAGGLMEFFSMSLGIKALTLIAVVAYLSAFLIHSRTSGSQVAAVKSTRGWAAFFLHRFPRRPATP